MLYHARTTIDKRGRIEIDFPDCPGCQTFADADEDPVAVAREALDGWLTNPVSFIAQKLLIYKSCDSTKRSQDVLYIHDTLELFGSELEVLRDLWRDHIRPSLARKVASDVVRLCREQFGLVTDVIRGAARIPGDRALTRDNLRVACAYGLGEVFDAS